MSASSKAASPGSNESALLAAIHSLPKEIRNLLAGGLAGMTAKSLVAPIDRIKILYQVTSAQFRLRDVPRVACSIMEKEGTAALWKGNTATMIRVFPYSGIQFMVFDYCKVHFLGEQKRKGSGSSGSYDGDRNQPGPYSGEGGRVAANISHRGTILVPKKATIPINNLSNVGDKQKTKPGLTPIESLVSGMIAGTISVLCTYPLDLARAQLAVLRKKKNPKVGDSATKIATKSKKKGIGYVLSHSYKNGGARGLYRGITPTILGILPYSGVAFTINEQAKRQISHITHRDPTTIEKLQCGALSGLFAQTLAYPLEVTRRRMQTIGIVPTSGTESAAVNFTGVSQLKPSVDELPQEVETTAETQKAKQPQQRLNMATSESIGSSSSTVKVQQPQQYYHHKPPSMMTTMRHLLEEQGIRGFYKGVSMNWVKGPVAFSISFTAFDTIQGWIETDEEKETRSRLAKISIGRRLTNNEDSD